MIQHAIFLVNLLQDVNIIRPLVFMTSLDLGLETLFLVSNKFLKRDISGLWQKELDEISKATGAIIHYFDSEKEALLFLQGKSGSLVAASESDLSAHSPTHNVFRLAPPSLVRITLQHGFECVGFLHSKDHNAAHGETVTFAADVVCGWCDASRLTSMVPSQRGKLYVSGPPAVLQLPQAHRSIKQSNQGLICENLHSVRLNIAGDFKIDFINIFHDFCAALAAHNKKITLRPHPGGQFVLKNNIPIPSNVILNNNPIYKVDLTRFAYGISAPSSVIIDMVLAGIPVAVWREGSGIMDCNNYKGLTEVSSLQDWIDFSREATLHPDRFIEVQQRFLESQKMPTDPKEVYDRFAKLFRATISNRAEIQDNYCDKDRLLFIANGFIPTLQLSFLKPLSPLIESSQISVNILTDEQINAKFGHSKNTEMTRRWIHHYLERYQPNLLIFCRYSGNFAFELVEYAKRKQIPILFHIDDDLLNVPPELGKLKYQVHNDPKRIAAIRLLLDEADMVYCSTNKLLERLRDYTSRSKSRFVSGQIYCPGEILSYPVNRQALKVGYMGFDHTHDFAQVLPAVIEYLRRNPNINFELFGSIPKPSALDEFGSRITQIPPIKNYEHFLSEFAKLNWDIGICPLTKTDFNLVKANTKWVEYTSVGTAVIASKNTVYDECCSDGCGLLANSTEEWLEALEKLTFNPDERYQQVQRAQNKLVETYSIAGLRNQVMDIINQTKNRFQKKERIIFIATNNLPTLQLSFFKPLSSLEEAGAVLLDLISDAQVSERAHQEIAICSNEDWIVKRLSEFIPTIIVFCRYNGKFTNLIVDWAKKKGIPTVFHIDDDLLNIPKDIGYGKYKYHNDPKRLEAIRFLLDNTDLVYCSTKRLYERFHSLKVKSPMTTGKIYCSGQILVPATLKPVIRKFGYMASADHDHNLQMILPAIVEFLRRNPTIFFEFFGSIPIPRELDEFGSRITTVPPIHNYNNFLAEFAKLGWDVGICPLTPINFNLMKANTKWVEYTSVGIAVIASRNTVYDECCADGCGILAETQEEWLAAFEKLAHNPDEHFKQVSSAQKKVINDYSIEKLRAQVLEVLEHAKNNSLNNQKAVLNNQVNLSTS
ncbi:TPA: glycosyltransferase [Legionella pneumophila]|uniref:glycosyltransferase family protein n=1 Tax=Legionella pneumophila TaxID=446 RepID=UPI001A357DB6|nr:glycosyltransferase [Legionella pneumophila]MCK1887569.1 glycosyltransferase [Legionella pneumophila]HAU1410977.1 glycosyltransferase family 4 protein [Legionella pneumophila]HBI2933221.1 glycosyltransferase [Legionella pneumophila]HCU6023493.1 glycosyltransferase [Legionella pneumophila]HDV5774270.1 glycosyltransferase [Legionella pneumophila]